MIIKINNKWEALHAVINTWLKDQRKYCNNCGQTFQPELGACCADMAIGTNFDVTLAIKRQNQIAREGLANDHASMKEHKQMRWGVSIPPDLFHTLDNYMKAHGHKKGLFETPSDLNKFMKKFPMFAIARKV